MADSGSASKPPALSGTAPESVPLSGPDVLRRARSERAAAREMLRGRSTVELATMTQEVHPGARGDFLMLCDSPEDVVPLLPEAELVHTIRASGMSEGAWLLEIATPEQRVACFDLDCWEDSEIVPARVHEWVDALIEAGRPTLLKAFDEVDLEVWLLAARAETEVGVFGRDDDRPDGWFTPDGVVYFGVHEGQDLHRMHEISHALFSENQALYWRLVYGLLFESPSEIAEYALRWRTNRLQDLGFPDREAAMRVYRPLPPEAVPAAGAPPEGHALVGVAELPRPFRGTLLGEALARLPADRANDVLRLVLSVTNAIAVADKLLLSDPESIPLALSKTIRGIDTGLRELVRVRRQAPEVVLVETQPFDLFRAGATVDPDLKGPYR